MRKKARKLANSPPLPPPFWSLFGPFCRKRALLYVILVVFFLSTKKHGKRSEKATKSGPKRSLFGGGRHGSSVVNSSKKLVFHVFEQAPVLSHFWLHFGLHFGAILETKFATILLSGRPGPQKGVKKAMEKKDKKTFLRGDAGMGRGWPLRNTNHPAPRTRTRTETQD